MPMDRLDRSTNGQSGPGQTHDVDAGASDQTESAQAQSRELLGQEPASPQSPAAAQSQELSKTPVQLKKEGEGSGGGGEGGKAAGPPTLQADCFKSVSSFGDIIAGKGVLRYGASDTEAVEILQGVLNGLGFECGKPDGQWGPGTQRGVKGFQGSAGLTSDGIIGQQSMIALDGAAAGNPGVTTVVKTKTEKAPPKKKDAPPPPADDTQNEKKAEEKPTEKPKETKTEEKPPQPANPSVAGMFAGLLNPATPSSVVQELLDDLGAALGYADKVTVPAPAADGPQSEGLQNAHLGIIVNYLKGLAGHVAEKGTATGLPETELKHVQKRISTLIGFYEQVAAGGTKGAVNPKRMAIVSSAVSQIGLVNSKAGGGEEGGRTTRQGWRALDAYFEKSYGGRSDGPGGSGGYNRAHQEQVKFLGPQLQSWCCHLMTWALKTNGYDCGNWPINAFSAFKPLPLSAKAEPGDVLYSDAHSNHYCIVISDDGSTFYTIDGNTMGSDVASGGQINTNRRSRGWFSGILKLKL